jgi:hypothetical protein
MRWSKAKDAEGVPGPTEAREKSEVTAWTRQARPVQINRRCIHVHSSFALAARVARLP